MPLTRYFRLVLEIQAGAETVPETVLPLTYHRHLIRLKNFYRPIEKSNLVENCLLSLMQKLVGQYLALRTTQQAAFCHQKLLVPLVSSRGPSARDVTNNVILLSYFKSFWWWWCRGM